MVINYEVLNNLLIFILKFFYLYYYMNILFRQVEVVDFRYRIVDLGVIEVIKNVLKKKKYILIINNSLVFVIFNLVLISEIFVFQLIGVFIIFFINIIILEFGGMCKVEVVFVSNSRIFQFLEEVTMEFVGQYEILFVVKGQCLGMEVSMDIIAISFFIVVKGSFSFRKFIMSNIGDMIVKYVLFYFCELYYIGILEFFR